MTNVDGCEGEAVSHYQLREQLRVHCGASDSGAATRVQVQLVSNFVTNFLPLFFDRHFPPCTHRTNPEMP